MKYGVFVPNFGPYGDARAMAALARDAEDAGWDGFFFWDQVAGTMWPPNMVDPWVALTAIALNTERIRIGTLVTPLPRRRPWKVARETVSIDHLSEGRLTFGVGIGAGPGEFDDLGEETNPKARGAMLDEALDVLTGLWSGETYSFAGTYYQINAAQFEPKPVQTPRIPIWVGGSWPNPAPFRRAARWDGVFPDPAFDLSPETTRELIEFVKKYRTTDAPFDVIHGGVTSGNHSQDVAIVAPYANVGVTWWMESVNPEVFGCEWKADWPIDKMRARILAGPPRISAKAS
jgi:probable F420-dependent oxidoreductase